MRHAILVLRARPRLYLLVEPDTRPGRWHRTRWLLGGPGWLWCRGAAGEC